jgi:hypothetical protein
MVQCEQKMQQDRHGRWQDEHLVRNRRSDRRRCPHRCAVVKPVTRSACRKMIPTPMNPIPETTGAAIRVGSGTVTSIEMRLNAHAPIEIAAQVRFPAERLCRSRSRPMAIPRTAAYSRPTAVLSSVAQSRSNQ